MSARAVVRAAAGVGAALLGLFAVRAGTLAPLAPRSGQAALLRLSWSARPERVEVCRRLGDAEFEALPIHMRLRTVCEGRLARYLLTATVDGVVVGRDTVQGSGLRHDRPMHVLREYQVPPGRRRVVIALSRIDSTVVAGGEAGEPLREDAPPGGDVRARAPQDMVGIPPAGESKASQERRDMEGRERREADERYRRTLEALPPRLTLDTVIALGPREAAVIAYDDVARRLVLRARP